jgi:hypothetical protein
VCVCVCGGGGGSAGKNCTNAPSEHTSCDTEQLTPSLHTKTRSVMHSHCTKCGVNGRWMVRIRDRDRDRHAFCAKVLDWPHPEGTVGGDSGEMLAVWTEHGLRYLSSVAWE